VLRTQRDQLIPITFRRQLQISLRRAQSALPHVRGKRRDQAIPDAETRPTAPGGTVHRRAQLALPAEEMTPGTKLGPYEILSQIGAGGMGEVYRARDPKLGRDVAIKVLAEAFARDSARMERFRREAKFSPR